MVLNPDMLGAIQGELKLLDIIILFAYFGFLITLGYIVSRKISTSEHFMLAGKKIPGWAAGLSVMCAYTSSISYIATPGKSFESNFHPFLFAVGMVPVAFIVCKFVVHYYRKIQLISVYQYLENKLGSWGRVYAALAFMLYMIGRIAVILYLACLLLGQFFTPIDDYTRNLLFLIVVVGIITIIYTLLGGMGAVIWADVVQAVIMLSGIAVCGGILTYHIVKGPDPAIATAWEAGKFSLGSLDFTLARRTIWVMIIYSVTENLRNLMADQNYVQKYISCSEEKEAKRSIWVATTIYVIMTFIFVYIGVALWSFYHGTGILEKAMVTKGDDVFPHYIATELFTGLRGLLIAAIMAAAISTIATAFNASATIWLQDFHKRIINPGISDRHSVVILRVVTVIWGVLGIGFALLMIKAQSALDVWWQISGIFGGGILGLFLLALLKVRLRLWQGVIAITASVLFIFWGSFLRESNPIYLMNLIPETWRDSIDCEFDRIIVGALGTGVLMLIAYIFSLTNRGKVVFVPTDEREEQEQENE